jgi:hypothetical protein
MTNDLRTRLEDIRGGMGDMMQALEDEHARLEQTPDDIPGHLAHLESLRVFSELLATYRERLGLPRVE